MMMSPSGVRWSKLPVSVIAMLFCAFAFFALLYAERITYRSSNPSSCSRKSALNKISSDEKIMKKDDEDEMIDDRFEFDPEECSVEKGKWVYNNSSMKTTLYSDTSCPYLDRQVSCVKNGRPDSEYRHWEWQPQDCNLPRFNAERALKKLVGKRLLFVGDSLQRGQWQSLVCMVEWIIPQHLKSMKRGRSLSVFTAKEYNATIEFYWAPYLVESNTDVNIIANPKERILKVDSVAKHALHWVGADLLVFNSYVWWTTGYKIKSLWGSFSNGEEGYEELDGRVAYRLGLKSWANWIDSSINPNKTRVFFTTMSPTHMRSLDWGRKDGIKCFNETRPAKKKFWGTGSDKGIMKVVVEVVKKMKVPVTFLNITQISEVRIDGHTSVYTETGGQLLTDEQKADPIRNADCIHWCLPGVPDTWNQILYAHL